VYRVYPKVRVADVINTDPSERLPNREFDYLSRAHFDFIVVKNELPTFAVEFDGADHIDNPETRERDVLKNRLCKKASLPLLRITSVEIIERDQVTLLDYMLMRFVAWEEEIDNILEGIQEYAANLPDDIDFEDFAIHRDPSVCFDLKHPFPGCKIVQERLWQNYRIAWKRDRRVTNNAVRYACDVQRKEAGQLHHDEFHTCRVSAFVHNSQSNVKDPVFSEMVEVTIRSWLPLDTEVPAPDIDLKKRIESIWFPTISGILPWDIAENYATYLGFRRIEQWAWESLRGNV
jgi:hypothetical protein